MSNKSNIPIPPPPTGEVGPVELEQWRHAIHLSDKPVIQEMNDAAITVGANTNYVGAIALTAGRQATLPAAADLRDGWTCVFQDEAGAAGTHTITIARAGTDTINGATSVTITSNYGRLVLIKRGSGTFWSA